VESQSQDGLASLLDIMNQFSGTALWELARQIGEALRQSRIFGEEKPSSARRKQIAKALADAIASLESLSLKQSPNAAAAVWGIIDPDENEAEPTWHEIGARLDVLCGLIQSELDGQLFLTIPEFQAKNYRNKQPFGKDVYDVFPNARFDAEEAATCLACDNSTASVFHLMRVVEWGLRALCNHLGLKKVRSSTKSGGKKYTPIPYTEWEHMINQLHPLVDKKIEKMKRGPKKQREQEFYYPILQDIMSCLS
jgi:hypothetical protein